MFKKFIGTKAFYRSVLVILLPIVIQQFITNFVSLLDNIMVGGLGEESISAVAIINQIIMVFYLAIFGGLSGCSIYGAQFFGKGDMEGVKNTFRFKLYFGMILSIAAILVFSILGNTFAQLFLQGENSNTAVDPQRILGVSQDYLAIMLWGLIPFMFVQVYAGTLREGGETLLPMYAGLAAIAVNLCGNYLLIEGHLFFPRLEAQGAAIATVLSRFVQAFILIFCSHRNKNKYRYFQAVYRTFHIPFSLCGKIIRTGTPLLVNEILWSLGMTVINQTYSTRSLNAMAALNITSTAWNLFCVIMFGIGSAISIMVGQKLGEGKLQEARDVDRKLIFLSVSLHILIGAVIVLCAPYIPLLYNVHEDVRSMASSLLVISGLSLPIHCFAHVTYFTIRSGGKTVITFLFDAVYTWLVSVSLAAILVNFTDMDLIHIYFCVQFVDILKVIIGLMMLKSDFWAQNLVSDHT